MFFIVSSYQNSAFILTFIIFFLLGNVVDHVYYAYELDPSGLKTSTYRNRSAELNKVAAKARILALLTNQLRLEALHSEWGERLLGSGNISSIKATSAL